MGPETDHGIHPAGAKRYLDLTTLLHRPYVFLFFAAFLAIGFLNRGLLRTFLFLVIGFSLAFLSEVSSIRNGFPYGMYHYVYENLQGEWMLWGIPLWDSLSYTFLAYAGYETAMYFSRSSTLILPTFLMVLLDVVADPLAVRGNRWFLGKIFYYPNGGLYFGVPLSNFAGWLLVAFVIFFLYQFFEKRFVKKPPPLTYPLLGPLFYAGILVFNVAITFWIGEVRLALTGIVIHAVIFFLLQFVIAIRQRRRSNLPKPLDSGRSPRCRSR